MRYFNPSLSRLNPWDPRNRNLDIVDGQLYHYKALGASTIVENAGTLFFNQDAGTQNLHRTNLVKAQFIDGFCKEVEIWGVGLRFAEKSLDIDDVIDGLRDSHFYLSVGSFSRQDVFGHGLDLVGFPSYEAMQTLTTVMIYRAEAQLGTEFLYPLLYPVSVKEGQKLEFRLFFITDVTGLHSKVVGVTLKGLINRGPRTQG